MKVGTKINKYINVVSLLMLVGVGFWFRWKGIVDNHSFWADEAFVSGVAKDLATGKFNLGQAMSVLHYQRLQVLLTALFFKLGGVSELVARLPSVIWGSMGVGLAYLIAKRLSNWGGGMLAGLLYALSQLNLAHATQAKPYAGLESLFLTMIWVSLNKKIKYRYAWLIILAIISSLLHVLGVISFVFVGMLFAYEYKDKIKTQTKYGWWLLGIMALAGVIGKETILNVLWQVPIYNNTTYLRELFWKNYGFLWLPAIFGLGVSFSKYKNIVLGIAVWSLVLLGFWNFKSYSHNIRYLIPFFGVMLVFVSVFWAKVGEKFFKDKWGLTALMVFILIYLGGNKISRIPLPYYNPNLDLYGDVQNADYKKMSQMLKSEFPQYQEMIIFNNMSDTENWYFTRLANTYFNKATNQSGVWQYGDHRVSVYISLNEFKRELLRYKSGLVIVEDWESFLPEDIKQYIKQNLKMEFRVEGLSRVGGSYPLEVYSWGM